jgi:hypothetical protein
MTGLGAPFSSPESRAALAWLKDFVRAEIPSDKLDAHAMRLLGEPRDVIDRETRELFEALRRQLPPEWQGMTFGLAFALREVIGDRIHEIEESAA